MTPLLFKQLRNRGNGNSKIKGKAESEPGVRRFKWVGADESAWATAQFNTTEATDQYRGSVCEEDPDDRAPLSNTAAVEITYVSNRRVRNAATKNAINPNATNPNAVGHWNPRNSAVIPVNIHAIPDAPTILIRPAYQWRSSPHVCM